MASNLNDTIDRVLSDEKDVRRATAPYQEEFPYDRDDEAHDPDDPDGPKIDTRLPTNRRSANPTSRTPRRRRTTSARIRRLPEHATHRGTDLVDRSA